MKEFEAMGLAHYGVAHYGVGHNAFTACVPRGTVEREAKTPRRTPPRTAAQKTVSSLESFDERLARSSKGKGGAS